MNDEGRFGQYGGRFIPGILFTSQQQLLKAYREAMSDNDFVQLVKSEMQHFSGRPTPLTFCENLTKKLGGAQIYLKREDLYATGLQAMKIRIT